MTAAQDVRDAAAWLTSPSAGGGRDWYSADAQAKLAAHAARLQAAADRLDRFERGTTNVAASAAPLHGPDDLNVIDRAAAALHALPEEPETRSVRSASGTARLLPPHTLADRVADLERQVDVRDQLLRLDAELASELRAFGGLRAIRLRLEQLEWPTFPRHPDLLNRDIYGAKGIPPDPPGYLVRPGIDYPRSAEELAPPVLRSRRRRRPWFVR